MEYILISFIFGVHLLYPVFVKTGSKQTLNDNLTVLVELENEYYLLLLIRETRKGMKK